MTRKRDRTSREPEAYRIEVPIDSIEEPTGLVRAIACISPPRLGRRSRAAELALDVASLVPRAALVICVAAFITSVVMLTNQRIFVCFGGHSKADIAKVNVTAYALEAYPEWRMDHPETLCPARLDELNEYTNNKNVRDVWGGLYEMSCSEAGMVVWSAGEDGQPGTADDIRSDE